MATPAGIVRLFKLCEAAGLTIPEGIRSNLDAAAKVQSRLYGDLADGDLLAAAERYLTSQEGRFWPVPGQILALANPPPNIDREADLAFVRALECAARRGQYQIPGTHFRFAEDPAVSVAIQAGIRACGGWVAFCMAKEGDPSVRRAFLDAYKAMRSEAERGQAILEGRRLAHRLSGGLLAGPTGEA